MTEGDRRFAVTVKHGSNESERIYEISEGRVCEAFVEKHIVCTMMRKFEICTHCAWNDIHEYGN